MDRETLNDGVLILINRVVDESRLWYKARAREAIIKAVYEISDTAILHTLTVTSCWVPTRKGVARRGVRRFNPETTHGRRHDAPDA